MTPPSPTGQEPEIVREALPLREQIARVIETCWSLWDAYDGNVQKPIAKKLEASLTKADEIIALGLQATLARPDRETTDHDEAQRVGGRDLALGAATPAIAHADACRLSRAFNQASDLRSDEDRRINEWLKELIAIAARPDSDQAALERLAGAIADHASSEVHNPPLGRLEQSERDTLRLETFSVCMALLASPKVEGIGASAEWWRPILTGLVGTGRGEPNWRILKLTYETSAQALRAHEAFDAARPVLPEQGGEDDRR